MTLNEFLHREFLENTYLDYLLFAILLLLGFFFRRFIPRLVSRLIYRALSRYTDPKHRDAFVEMVRKPIAAFILVFFIVVAFNQLHYPSYWNLSDTRIWGIKSVVDKITGLLFIITITWIILRVIDFFGFAVQSNARNRRKGGGTMQIMQFGKDLFKVLLVILAVFYTLGAVFHVNVASLIAGLGIGGLAIALAAQDTLANLLGSFVIFLDKPFEVGDYVQTADFSGNVEHVGFRSTQIRTAEKSLLIVPNKKLVDSLLNNITRSSSRRIRFLLGLDSKTTYTQLQDIITELKAAIQEHPMVDKESVTVAFENIGETAFQLEVVYLVKTGDGGAAQNVKAELNFRCMQIVEKHGSGFAFPTSTVYLQSPRSPLTEGNTGEDTASTK